MKNTVVSKLFDEAQGFFDYEYRTNPLTYLIAKDTHRFYSKIDIAPDNAGKGVLESYAKNYLDRLRAKIEEDEIYSWDEDYPENSILFKNFGKQEDDFFRARGGFTLIDNDSFIQKQYPLRFFNLELPLNDTQSIHLHQYISSSYESTLENALVKLNENEDTEHMKIIDFTNSFTVNNDFDFVSFHDQEDIGNSFTVISNLKPFEKLYNFIEQYKQAFDLVSTLDCLDLSNLKETEDCWRKCASLLKYEDRDECIKALKVNLLSHGTTFPKTFIEGKGIDYRLINGSPVLIPKNPRQFKIIIKILSDKLAKTYLMQKDVISDRFEEFSSS